MIVEIVKVEGVGGDEFYADDRSRRLTIYLGGSAERAAERFRELFEQSVAAGRFCDGAGFRVDDEVAQKVFREHGRVPVDPSRIA